MWDLYGPLLVVGGEGSGGRKENAKRKEDMAKLGKVEESEPARHPLEVVSNVEDHIINQIAQD